MTTLASSRSVVPPSAGAGLARLLHARWVWCAMAIAYVVTFGIGYHGRPLAIALGDSDDATRLLQVRAVLAGAGWYDLTIGQLGADPALVSHWSRLLDVPLALGIGAFAQITSPERAEVFVRAVWPALLLFVLLRVLAHEADARAGMRAAAVAVVLGITALTGLLPFKAGRIDHHNVMVLATVAGLLLMARSFDDTRRAARAGASLGFALVIGYEPLALIAPLAALAALVTVWQPRRLAAVSAGIMAMAIVLALGVMVSRPPSQWLTSACDAISVNLVLLVAGVATALSLTLERGAHWSWSQRFAVLSIGGAAGLAVALAVEPACLGGPFAMLSADAKRLWLADVIEAAPVTRTLFLYPLVMIVFTVFAALAIASAFWRAKQLRAIEATATAVCLAAAFALALLQMKFMPYATALAVVALAVGIATRAGNTEMSAPVAALIGAVLVNQITLSALAMPFANRLEANDAGAASGALTGHGCEDVPAMRTIAALPPGLVAAHVNFGAFLAASTHHRALAAPYHRIADDIVAVHRIFTAPPPAAEALLRAHRVDYVMQCRVPGLAPDQLGFGASLSAGSLAAHLSSGQVPDYLQRVPLGPSSGALEVFRVLPPR